MRISSRLLATLSAGFVLANGIWHLALWNDRYRDLPGEIPGVAVVQQGFLVQAAVSLALAIALLVLPRSRLVALAALGLEVGSLLALIDARTTLLLGWQDKVYDTASIGVIGLELPAIVLLGLLLWRQTAERRSSPQPEEPATVGV